MGITPSLETWCRVGAQELQIGKETVNKQVRHRRGLKHVTKCLRENESKKNTPAQEGLRNIFRNGENQKLYEEIILVVKFHTVEGESLMSSTKGD